VAKFNERDVKRLMADTGIVRNEKKIRSTIYNANQFQEISLTPPQRRRGASKRTAEKVQTHGYGHHEDVPLVSRLSTDALCGGEEVDSVR
jgi:3-methyladenine DNA glycosylase Tag